MLEQGLFVTITLEQRWENFINSGTTLFRKDKLNRKQLWDNARLLHGKYLQKTYKSANFTKDILS